MARYIECNIDFMFRGVELRAECEYEPSEHWAWEVTVKSDGEPYPLDREEERFLDSMLFQEAHMIWVDSFDVPDTTH